MKLLFISIFCLLLLGCKNYPADVDDALNKMERKNRRKFINVINHFNEEPGDSLKLKAAYFIISNIGKNGYYQGSQLNDYDELFEILNNKPSDYRENLPWYSNELNIIFDSLKNQYGELRFDNLYFVKDEDVMSYEFLIKYIDQSFEAWNYPWNRNVSFNDFCNYILPYRNFKEPLEEWRDEYFNNYKWILDSLNGDEDIIDIAYKLNIDSELKYSEGFNKYITSIAPSKLLDTKYGTCADNSNFKAMVLRTFGIPVAIDYIPQYGDDHNSHYWNSVMDRNGNFVSFDEALNDINASVAYKYKIGKVFRRTFTKNEQLVQLNHQGENNVPPTFKDVNLVDVTNQYVATSTVNIKLNPSQLHKYAFLAVFNNSGWTPIDYSVIDTNGNATFKKVGRNVMFLPVYYVDEQIVPASLPFYISSKGFIKYISLKEEKEDVELTRKYHYYPRKNNWLNCLIHGRFEGSNNIDFRNSTILHIIKERPGEMFQELEIKNDESFKYIRFVFSKKERAIIYDGDGASMAEIEIYNNKNELIKGSPFGSEGRKYNTYTAEKCFDGNLLTFFEDARNLEVEKYVGLAFEHSQLISKIRYLPRNDLNSIQTGNLYELFYWNNDSFVSLGKQLASGHSLIYKDVPQGALLWLRNLTEGKEERIFTYEQNVQVWW